MLRVDLKRIKGLRGEITVPPDKSISHRAIMFGSLADGRSRVRNFLRAEDPLSTVNSFRMLGIDIAERDRGELVIEGTGVDGLREPSDVIDCGNSGTTMRLLSGILSGNPFFSVLNGDDSLRQRPMGRVITPLRQMGASIAARDNDRYPPMAIQGKRLRALEYTMPVASAQVKSCLLLAGLYAEGVTAVTEPYKSRDHTERMLASMGASLETDGFTVRIKGGARLGAVDITVPSDFSSAAFFVAAALVVPDAEILIQGAGVNPTRTGLLSVIRGMGASVKLENEREVSGEPVAELVCRTADHLAAVKIGGDLIPSVIDEFPILCVIATQAEGITEIRDAAELRVKESDRIRAMVSELRKLGAELEEYPDGVAIKGTTALKGCHVESYGDHRIAMALSVAALIAEGVTTINDASCVDISFPGFFEELRRVTTEA